MNIVTQAFVWGIQDKVAGKSIFTGCDYFVGQQLVDYNRGHNLAKQVQPVAEPNEMELALAEVEANGPRWTQGMDFSRCGDSLDDYEGR